MPTNKSPGMNGLTMEFYRMFWDVFGLDLVIVWPESLQSGVLPLSCRPAVLTLLPKKGDLHDLWNWCPVSLLSTDYKVIAKAISLLLGSVLADLVHPNQTYTVPGRTIFDNLYLIRDLLELGCKDSLSFALLSLDQEKAFDRLDHEYLLGTLWAFGFGPQFVGFLQVLYANAECLVRLNWTLTEPVSFGRGVRQRCPLSGQLYALAIEPFLRLLRRRLTGLALREPELRLVLSVTCSSWSRTRTTWCGWRPTRPFTRWPPPPGSTRSRALAWWSGTGGRRAPSHPCFKQSGGAQVRYSILAFISLPRILLHWRTGRIWRPGWVSGCGDGQDCSGVSPCEGGRWC
ncbi:unnamed protein product [Caretta caretta]